MSAPCRVCGRPLDDCGTCVCASRHSLAQERPLDAFLRYAVATCVEGGAARPGLDAPPADAVCQHCGRALTFVGPDWCSSCDGGES